MRVLITGAGGQVGREVAELCARHGDDVIATTRARLDVTDPEAVLEACTTLRPEIIVHTAAWTAVDECEGDPDRAFLHNADATRHVAEGARRCRAHLVHLSTDYVFDGTKAAPYVEHDEPNPVSVYGRSKLDGEREASALDGATIIRTSWVCGRHGQNFVKTVLRLAGGDGPLRFVDDQIGSPTVASDLAVMVRRLAAERGPGLFHVTNQGSVSWWELARTVVRAAGGDPARVEPITTAELDPPRAAPRPANSVLDNQRLRLSGVPLLPAYEGSIVALVKSLALSGDH